MTVPGLSLEPGWLGDESPLLAAIDAGEWASPLRRRVQHFGHRYGYGRRGVVEPAPPLPDWALALGERLAAEGRFATVPDQVIVNEYLPGQGISAHVDHLGSFGPVVASVTLGSGCDIDFADPVSGARVAVRADPGDLLVMTGPSRTQWRHSIAARRSDPGPSGRIQRGRRVSVTFRTVL